MEGMSERHTRTEDPLVLWDRFNGTTGMSEAEHERELEAGNEREQCALEWERERALDDDA